MVLQDGGDEVGPRSGRDLLLPGIDLGVTAQRPEAVEEEKSGEEWRLLGILAICCAVLGLTGVVSGGLLLLASTADSVVLFAVTGAAAGA